MLIIKGEGSLNPYGNLYGQGGRRGPGPKPGLDANGDKRDSSRGNNFGPPAPGGPPTDDASKAKETEWIDFTQDNTLANTSGHPAETVRPLIVSEIAFSFPYRLQLEEFQRKLRMKTVQEVLTEINEQDKDESEDGPGQGQNAFRFVGVDLQRREVDARGEPILDEKDKNAKNKDELGWKTVDLEAEYVDYVLQCGQVTEPEDDPRLEDVSFPGLVMPRLRTFRDKAYPPLESDLPTIKGTLDEIKNAKKADVAKPRNAYNRKNFDPWRGRGTEMTSDSKNPMAPMMPTGMDRRRRDGRDAPQASDKDIIPDY
jgi:hypothetical protein